MLKEALSPLKESSKSAIADADCDSFDAIKSYLHLERDIEGQLTSFLEAVQISNSKKLFLVCGNVGDGKSHLLASIRLKKTDILSDVLVYNDATESSEPDSSYIDELNKILLPFSDQHIDKGSEKVVLAINLGTLNNFISADIENNFSEFKEYVRNKKILELGDIIGNEFEESSPFQFVNFCDHNLFYLSKDGPISELIEMAIEKIVSPKGPFYKAYEEQKKLFTGAKCPICYNFEALGSHKIRRKIAALIIECIIKGEVIVSIRALYNFIYELIVPIDIEPLDREATILKIEKYNDKEFLENIFPNYMFSHPELSELFTQIQIHDPSFRRGEIVDEAIVKLVVSENPLLVVDEFIEMNEIGDALANVFLTSSPDTAYINAFIRTAFFWPKDDSILVADPVYENYMKLMFDWYSGNTKELKALYRLVKNAVISWRGQAGTGKINVDVGRQQLEYRISESIEIKPEPPTTSNSFTEKITEFNATIPLLFNVNGDAIPIAISYNLFHLVIKIEDGYRPTNLDHSNFVVFDEFVQTSVTAGAGQKQMFVTESVNKKQFILEVDGFGDFCFSEVAQ
jgi:DNA phosphorothioation-dependent restriction protein DptF